MDDVVWLSRVQFALTISFHYIFPPLSIGLGVLLVALKGLWLKTKEPIYHQLSRFWTKIFALTFAIGVASGIVMEFEFGTNWATYSRFVGDVFGSPLAAEGIFAFFLESVFLGLLLFGWNKIGPKMHFVATFFVAAGAHLSALWIITANSWQQTPAGYKIVGEGVFARAEITSFWEMVFNPSTVTRLLHTLSGAWIAGGVLAMSVGAFYLLKKRHIDFGKISLKVGLVIALCGSLFQLYTGHDSAVIVSKYQPAKLAAMEGLYESRSHAPMYVIGWVDEKNEKTYGIELPGFLSLFAKRDFDAEIQGLHAFKPEDRPGRVNFIFQIYHLMVIIGCAMIALFVYSAIQLARGKLYGQRWLLWIIVFAIFLPNIANQLGWWTAEVGRQPWIVYGLLRTSEGFSKVVSAEAVLSSIILFSVVYAILFTLFIYLLTKKILKGPDPADLEPHGKLDISHSPESHS